MERSGLQGKHKLGTWSWLREKCIRLIWLGVLWGEGSGECVQENCLLVCVCMYTREIERERVDLREEEIGERAMRVGETNVFRFHGQR